MIFGLAWRSNDEVWFNASRTTRAVQTNSVRLDGSERAILSTAGDFEIVDISKEGRALFFRTTVRARMFFGAGGADRERLAAVAWPSDVHLTTILRPT